MNQELLKSLDALYVVYDSHRDTIMRYRSDNDIILFGDAQDVMTSSFDAQATQVADLPEDIRMEIYYQEAKWSL